ncbi:Gis4p CYBJADRAFT_168570 [Cyberlindnera jadinii NRRL Y-1542]|uniref:Uncharacterized protein n=1 Tax=Cyberlindnera jadinii (strain ATCC 18201 / CBS 1600 / BCRC 20928 / JCM 3617 / NBRC 0987 / NRRL Y-1542) TaxID=983966 RepID=A0A1E4RZJ2_CYBJN|nr:hypothetical protein CYBJADRAFT_168570 [Cyberlindnera jadinii NRRL Y-1542]ODV72667.1 hypothetical protein CYBJADRAFT_168570 [Cyberlindnera jadinii NRRL Y-1542]
MPTFVYNNLDASQEDDYSRLWTWYVAHLESGEFEGIVDDTMHRRQLDRFISENSTSYDSNVLILLMDTNEINRNPNLLTSLMSKYYMGSDAKTITITPMGAINDNKTSVILIKDNTRQVPTFNTNARRPSEGQCTEAESILSGEPGYVPSIVQRDALIDRTLSEDAMRTTVEVNNDDDDTHSLLSDTDLPQSPRSVNSFEGNLGSPEQPIIRVDTHLSSSQHSFEVGDSETMSMMTDDTGNVSLQPFPTNVSATSATDNKLVLRSILLKDLQTNEIKTAIRQIENSEMADDWLVYDETFTMTNLQLLSLDDIVESNAMSCKFLFYALVEDTPDEDETDEDVGEHDLTVVEFDGKLDDLSPQIRFINTNNTELTTPIQLSKTNTIHTNYESIRSELVVHKPDTWYTPVSRAKSSDPNPHSGGAIRKLRKKRSRSRVNTNEKCIVM